MPRPPTTPTNPPLLTIKSRTGELDAASREPADHVQIMVELLPGVTPDAGVGTKVVNVGVDAVAEGNPIWLDTTCLPASPAGAPARVLTDFDDRLDTVIQEMVPGYDHPVLLPVVAANADASQLRAMRHFLEHKPRPVVVRVPTGALAGAEPWARTERIADSLRLAVDDLHLVFDEGYVGSFGDRRVHELSATINGLARRQESSSVAVLGGSIPERREPGTRTSERVEVRLWKAVRAECGNLLRYGDYGVVNPHPPKRAEKRPRSPNPYLHYTVPGGVLSLVRRVPDRGHQLPRGAAEHFFREVAEELVQRPEFAGPDFSWGDRNLESCRRSNSVHIGRSSSWIALATSHHLAHLSKGLYASPA